MKKNLYISVLSLISLSAFSYDSALDLYSGEKVKINVLGCKSDEISSVSLDQKTNTVSVKCAQATCQAVPDKGIYKVYRFQGEECTWNGCNREARLVGQFSSKKSLLTKILKSDMEAFLRTSKDCGSLKSFVNGYHGFIEIKK